MICFLTLQAFISPDCIISILLRNRALFFHNYQQFQLSPVLSTIDKFRTFHRFTTSILLLSVSFNHSLLLSVSFNHSLLLSVSFNHSLLLSVSFNHSLLLLVSFNHTACCSLYRSTTQLAALGIVQPHSLLLLVSFNHTACCSRYRSATQLAALGIVQPQLLFGHFFNLTRRSVLNTFPLDTAVCDSCWFHVERLIHTNHNFL